MDLNRYTRKDIGNLGERVACEYLRRRGFAIVARNVAAKTGELDIVAKRGTSLHVVEVKSIKCPEFQENESKNHYNPAQNLHRQKLQKVVRTAQWYVAKNNWEGGLQIDGALVWLRERDGLARIQYYPQVL